MPVQRTQKGGGGGDALDRIYKGLEVAKTLLGGVDLVDKFATAQRQGAGKFTDQEIVSKGLMRMPETVDQQALGQFNRALGEVTPEAGGAGALGAAIGLPREEMAKDRFQIPSINIKAKDAEGNWSEQGTPFVSAEEYQKKSTEEGKLVDDFEKVPAVKALQVIAPAYTAIESAIANPSPTNDSAAITLINKMMDPTSVVRNEEFDRIAKMTGIEGKLKTWWERARSGKLLGPEGLQIRNDILNTAKLLVNAHMKGLQPVIENYNNRASGGGFLAKNVTGSVSGLIPDSALERAQSQKQDETSFLNYVAQNYPKPVDLAPDGTAIASGRSRSSKAQMGLGGGAAMPDFRAMSLEELRKLNKGR